MTIPSESSLYVVSISSRPSSDHILDSSSQKMTIMRKASRERRSIVEGVTRTILRLPESNMLWFRVFKKRDIIKTIFLLKIYNWRTHWSCFSKVFSVLHFSRTFASSLAKLIISGTVLSPLMPPERSCVLPWMKNWWKYWEMSEKRNENWFWNFWAKSSKMVWRRGFPIMVATQRTYFSCLLASYNL